MSLPFGGMFSSRRSESDEADVAREQKRGQRSRAQVGVIGIVVIGLVVITAMQMDKLPYISPISTYTAYFDDAGGLTKGDIVSVSGVQVGTVESIALAGTDAGTKVKVGFRMDDTVEMGSDSQAAIRTETVLGRRNLTVIPHGGERIKPGGSIPIGNTISPYSLQDALEGATDTVADTDTEQLNEALNTLTITFSETPDQVQGAVNGVARLSKAVADRDNELRALLAKANQVSKIVGDRNEQINRLLVDANALVGEIEMRRYALNQLIKGIGDVTAQLRGFIAENNAQLTPGPAEVRPCGDDPHRSGEGTEGDDRPAGAVRQHPRRGGGVGPELRFPRRAQHLRRLHRDLPERPARSLPAAVAVPPVLELPVAAATVEPRAPGGKRSAARTTAHPDLSHARADHEGEVT